AAIGGDHGNPTGVEHMLGPARQPLRENRRVFAQPELVRRRWRSGRGECLHRLVGGQVFHRSDDRRFHQGLPTLFPPYKTTLTIGWLDNVRYSSSSCSRLVALIVIVTPR